MSLFGLIRFLHRKCIGHYLVCASSPVTGDDGEMSFLLSVEGQGYRVSVTKVELAS